MQKIIDYTIIYGNTDQVIQQVKEYIQAGWQPFGGLQNADRGQNYFAQQPMVKYAD